LSRFWSCGHELFAEHPEQRLLLHSSTLQGGEERLATTTELDGMALQQGGREAALPVVTKPALSRRARRPHEKLSRSKPLRVKNSVPFYVIG
jgi:hypothetical protein